MTPSKNENLLWQLTRLQEKGNQNLPSREELEDYRGGRLSEEATSRLEERLAASVQGRERLSQIASLPALEAPEQVRARVLPATESIPTEGGTVLPFPVWKRILPLAAVLLLAFGVLYRNGSGMRLAGGGGEPLPEFSVNVKELSEFRSATPEQVSRSGSFYAQSAVVITVRPWEAAQAGLDFGLYRKVGESYERVVTGGAVEARVSRGVASFNSTAADLVGVEPGTYSLYVVIAREGDLPSKIAARSGLPSQEVLAGGNQRQVSHVSLTVLPELASEPLSENGLE